MYFIRVTFNICFPPPSHTRQNNVIMHRFNIIEYIVWIIDRVQIRYRWNTCLSYGNANPSFSLAILVVRLLVMPKVIIVVT